MNYYVREINSCESRILDKIDIIKRYGIDTDEYEQSLKEILNSETEDVDYSMGGTAVKNMLCFYSLSGSFARGVFFLFHR